MQWILVEDHWYRRMFSCAVGGLGFTTEVGQCSLVTLFIINYIATADALLSAVPLASSSPGVT